MQLPPCIKLHGSNPSKGMLLRFSCLHLKYAQITNSEDYLYKILSNGIVCQVLDSLLYSKIIQIPTSKHLLISIPKERKKICTKYHPVLCALSQIGINKPHIFIFRMYTSGIIPLGSVATHHSKACPPKVTTERLKSNLIYDTISQKEGYLW